MWNELWIPRTAPHWTTFEWPLLQVALPEMLLSGSLDRKQYFPRFPASLQPRTVETGEAERMLLPEVVHGTPVTTLQPESAWMPFSFVPIRFGERNKPILALSQ